jgi:exosome complex component RRP41
VYGPRAASGGDLTGSGGAASSSGSLDKKAQRDQNECATIVCDFGYSLFASAGGGTGRRRRRAPDRRSVEASAALRQVFETVLDARLYPRSVISIHIMVLESDGGALAASINAATLALIDAGIALRDFALACGATFLQRVPFVDPTFVEESSGGPQLTLCVTPRDGKVVLCAMDARLPLDAFKAVMDHAVAGCAQMHDILRETVRERMQQRIDSREATLALSAGAVEGGGLADHSAGDWDGEETRRPTRRAGSVDVE